MISMHNAEKCDSREKFVEAIVGFFYSELSTYVEHPTQNKAPRDFKTLFI